MDVAFVYMWPDFELVIAKELLNPQQQYIVIATQ
jgi:hypothetical protein